MIPEYISYSAKNLKRIFDKVQKYANVRDECEVELAIQSLCFYHCVRQVNVISVIQEGKIKTKNLIYEGEMSNNHNDYVQGFDRHISLSVGEPWPEYGNYSFVFGIEKISESSMFFFKDPWLFGNRELAENVLTKQDFIELSKILIRKNLMMVSRKILIKKFRKTDLTKLLKYNVRKFEIKQDKTLSISDADEFFMWSRVDNALYGTSKIFFSMFGFTAWLIIFCYIIIVVVAVG